MADNRTTILHTLSNGHARRDHLDEFGDPRLGRTITEDPTPRTMARYAKFTLEDPNAQVMTANPNPPRYPNPVHYIYSETLNTMVVLDPANGGDLGTVFRPEQFEAKMDSFRRNAVTGIASQGRGPEAVNRAYSQFERDAFRNPEARATIERNARAINQPVHEPPRRNTPTAPQAEATPSPNAAASAAAGSALENAGEEVTRIIESEHTTGFMADADGKVAFYINSETNTVVRISGDEVVVQQFDNPADANRIFGEQWDEATQKLGELPDLVDGGHAALAENFHASRGFWPKLGSRIGDVVEIAGRTAKVLGPLGVIGATAEAAELGFKAHLMDKYDMLPEGFVERYDALLLAHVGQATVDPSMLGGELGVQALFDELCEEYEIPAHIKAEIEPGSLLETLFGDTDPNATSTDPNASYNDPFFEIYDNLPAEINSDMPPEVQALIEFKTIIEAENSNMTYLHGGDRYNAQQRLEAAEAMYTDLYDTMLEDGQIEAVQAYLSEHSTPANPETAPAEEPATRSAENSGVIHTPLTPM